VVNSKYESSGEGVVLMSLLRSMGWRLRKNIRRAWGEVFKSY
jgi:hypothetical protein